MSFIENVSKSAVFSGSHSDMGEDAVLIQIVDPASYFPVPNKKFARIHQFEFLDLEDTEPDKNLMEFAITDEQAAELVGVLKQALDENRNVIVHCHAGLCRSGAVAEVGVMMGFTHTERTKRTPNVLVKTKMMRVLGWTYD